MISIAVDGHSSSGKGTHCNYISEKLHLKHLDTGAILRAMGLFLFEKGIENPTEKDINDNVNKINIDIEFDKDKQITKLNKTDVSGQIRTENIGSMASKVAKFPVMMNKMNEIAREFAKHYDCIIDGRNITSEVLPNADVKLFITASAEERAKWRLAEEKSKGLNSTFEQIYESLKIRDYNDEHRQYSPLTLTPDSIKIDCSGLNVEQAKELVLKTCCDKLKRIGKLK